MGEITLQTIRKTALALPGVVEGLSYRTPAFRVNGKLLCRLHQDGEVLVVHCNAFEREMLLDTSPKVFFLTDHYAPHTWILVRLKTATTAQLAQVLRHAWQQLKGAAKKPAPRRKR